MATFGGYVKTYGDNFILSIGGSRRTYMTVDADVFQYVLQRNHKNYEKSEIQTDQMTRYFGCGTSNTASCPGPPLPAQDLLPSWPTSG